MLKYECLHYFYIYIYKLFKNINYDVYNIKYYYYDKSY